MERSVPLREGGSHVAHGATGAAPAFGLSTKGSSSVGPAQARGFVEVSWGKTRLGRVDI